MSTKETAQAAAASGATRFNRIFALRQGSRLPLRRESAIIRPSNFGMQEVRAHEAGDGGADAGIRPEGH